MLSFVALLSSSTFIAGVQLLSESMAEELHLSKKLSRVDSFLVMVSNHAVLIVAGEQDDQPASPEHSVPW